MRRKNITSEMMMEYIQQALLLLMKDKAYPDITIGEITAKAGVNRSTYYRHFDTKESIIHSYLDSIMETYQKRFQQLHSQDFTLYLRTMFETFYENKENLTHIHQSGLTMFETFYENKENLTHIHQSGLSYMLLDVLMARFHFDEIPSDQQFRISYHIGGINSNMLLWLAHDMKETPDEMTIIALQCGAEKSLSLFRE